MRLLYVTDLHGDVQKYEKTLEIALRKKVFIVVNGGDMLPYGGQDEFLRNYLPDYFERFSKAKIYYLCMLGNDDLCLYDEDFRTLCHSKKEYIQDIAQHKVEVLGYEFIGMSYVLDYPFRLKDRCRLDSCKDHINKKQYGTPLFSVYKEGKASSERSLLEPFDLTDLYLAISGSAVSSMSSIAIEQSRSAYNAYLRRLPTIEQELDKLPTPTNMNKCIYVIHEPPYGIGLDVIQRGKIGSQAVHNFLSNKQPFLSLHGHVHESPCVSGKWFANIGKTICIQPGQMPLQRMPKGLQEYFTTYVLIDLDSGVVKRVDEPLHKGGADAFCF